MIIAIITQNKHWYCRQVRSAYTQDVKQSL